MPQKGFYRFPAPRFYVVIYRVIAVIAHCLYAFENFPLYAPVFVRVLRFVKKHLVTGDKRNVLHFLSYRSFVIPYQLHNGLFVLFVVVVIEYDTFAVILVGHLDKHLGFGEIVPNYLATVEVIRGSFPLEYPVLQYGFVILVEIRHVVEEEVFFELVFDTGRKSHAVNEILSPCNQVVQFLDQLCFLLGFQRGDQIVQPFCRFAVFGGYMGEIQIDIEGLHVLHKVYDSGAKVLQAGSQIFILGIFHIEQVGVEKQRHVVGLAAIDNHSYVVVDRVVLLILDVLNTADPYHGEPQHIAGKGFDFALDDKQCFYFLG